MDSISNRFFVTALDDGTTLHGNMSVAGSLSQAWNGTAAVPDWGSGTTTGTKDQPEIMMTLISGTTYIGTDSSSPNGYISEQKWYYNSSGTESEITFDSTTTTITLPDGSTVTGYKSNGNFPDMFLKHTASLNFVTVPALRIIKNLASGSNVDVDYITFKGKYNSGSGILDFETTAQIRISLMSSGGYLGVISFTNGKSDITEDNQSVTMTGTLYGSNDNNAVSCKTQWFLNGVQHKALSNVNTDTVTEAEVVDNAVVRCDFYVTKNNVDTLVATAYANIDDMQDNEYMYIQYNGANGNAASLRNGQTATFNIWVGKSDDATVDTSFAYFQVKLLNGSGSVITAHYDGIPDVVSGSDGWRNLIVDGTTHKASLSITYDVANANGKNITGILRASTAQFT